MIQPFLVNFSRFKPIGFVENWK